MESTGSVLGRSGGAKAGGQAAVTAIAPAASALEVGSAPANAATYAPDFQVSAPLLSEIRRSVDASIAAHAGAFDGGTLDGIRSSAAAAIDMAVSKKATRHVAVLKAVEDAFRSLQIVRAVAYRPVSNNAWKVYIVHDDVEWDKVRTILKKTMDVEDSVGDFTIDSSLLPAGCVEGGGLEELGAVIFDRRGPENQ